MSVKQTTRERREARAEKRWEWAEGREAKAKAASQTAHQLAGLEPLGEPMHDGSAGRRQRTAKKRLRAKSAQAAEHSQMARRHDQAASTIESQLERSVYSDDPDAIERLRERIADNEAKREAMKGRNAEFREANREKLKELSGHQRDLVMPHQGFELTNLGARIRQDRKRLAALEGTRS
jgi:hypothetical protein